MEPSREAATEGGGGATSVRHVYRAVVQVVLIFGDDTWVLSEAVSRNMEGGHVGFLRQITGQRAV